MRSLKTDKNVYLLGTLLGLFSAVSPSSFIILVSLALVSLAMYGALPQEDRDFVIGIFLAGVTMRMIFAVLFYYLYLLPGRLNFIAPDGETYSQQAWYISNVMAGRNLYVVPSAEYVFSNFFEHVNYYAGRLPNITEYEIGVVTYLLSFIYTIFGYVPLAFKLINSIFGALLAVIVYDIARSIFDRKVAILSMILVMFWPSLVIFSATNLKDPAIILCIYLALWAVIKFQKESHPSYLAALAGAFILLLALRIYVAAILAASITIYFLSIITLRLKPLQKWLVVIVTAAVLLNPTMLRLFEMGINTMLTKQHAFSWVTGGISNYRIYPEIFYQTGGTIGDIGFIRFVISYAKGVLYFLFSPFLWDIKSVELWVTAIFNIVWYVIFFFSVNGALRAFSRARNETLLIIIFLVAIITIFALTSGNIGTVCRHRDMLVPFFIIFGIAGITRKEGRG